MKVGKKNSKKKIPSIFLAIYWNLSSKSGNLKNKNLWGMKNVLFRWKSYFSGRNLAKIRQ